MFEREVKFIYDFSSNKVKKLGTYVSYPELKEIGIHPAILKYVAAEIEYRIFEDREALLKHSMFDYSGEKISKYFSLISEEIKKEKKFSVDFINKIILHASSFNVNYLIRPNWSLKKLIFDVDRSKSTSEIKHILNYVYYYDFVIKVLKDYIDKKKLISLNKEEFDDLLKRIDKVGSETHIDDILDQAIDSMSSFFNIGSFNKNTVPLQGMGIFLKEKNLISHINALQKAIGDETRSQIDKKDLKSILLGKYLDKTEYFEVSEEETDDFELENEAIVQESEKPKDKLDEKLGLTENEENIQDEQEEITTEDTSSRDLDKDYQKEEIEEKEKEPVFEDKSVGEPSKKRTDEEENEITADKTDEEIKLRNNKEKEVDEIVSEMEEDYNSEQEFPGEIFKDEDEYEEKKPEVEETERNDDVKIKDEQETESTTAENEEEHVPDEEEEETLISTGQIEQFPDSEEPEGKEPGQTYKDENNEQDSDEPKIEEGYIINNKFDKEILERESKDKDDESKSEEAVFDGKDEEEEPDNVFDKLKIDDENFEDITLDKDEDEDSEPTLFGDDPELATDEEDESNIEDIDEPTFLKEYGRQDAHEKIDISELLENKNMTKIIQVVFDYDMEEFANSIERICGSSSKQEAFIKLEEVLEINHVNPSSKEAQAFREIIAEYFDQS